MDLLTWFLDLVRFRQLLWWQSGCSHRLVSVWFKLLHFPLVSFTMDFMQAIWALVTLGCLLCHRGSSCPIVTTSVWYVSVILTFIFYIRWMIHIDSHLLWPCLFPLLGGSDVPILLWWIAYLYLYIVFLKAVSTYAFYILHLFLLSVCQLFPPPTLILAVRNRQCSRQPKESGENKIWDWKVSFLQWWRLSTTVPPSHPSSYWAWLQYEWDWEMWLGHMWPHMWRHRQIVSADSLLVVRACAHAPQKLIVCTNKIFYTYLFIHLCLFMMNGGVS